MCQLLGGDLPGDADSERQLQLARERRDQLLRDEKWIDAPAVHVRQGGRPDVVSVPTGDRRDRGEGEHTVTEPILAPSGIYATYGIAMRDMA